MNQNHKLQSGADLACADLLDRENRVITIGDICKSASVIRQNLPQGWPLWLAVLILRGVAAVASAALALPSAISKYASRWRTARKGLHLGQRHEGKAP